MPPAQSLPVDEWEKARPGVRARARWELSARRAQLTPFGTWNVWLYMAGRGAGKTRAAAEDMAYFGLTHPGSRLAVVAPTYADARDTCVEGESGLLACLPKQDVHLWNRSLGELVLKNGARYKLFSSDEPERLRGPQHHRAWCDELAHFRDLETWDMLQMGLRLGENPQCVITTTPRPLKLLRELLSRADVVVTRGSTWDNAANLAPAALESLRRRYEGTRLGRQELEGQLIEDIEGALWSRSWFERDGFRAPEHVPFPGGADQWQRAPVVGVDPADGTEDGDEQAFTVAGLGMDHKLYVVESEGMRTTPPAFASAAIDAALRHGAVIVLEKNHGGAALVSVFDRVMRDRGVRVPMTTVHASQGKRTRAEPVAALYEQGHVRHVGHHLKLEDQMCVAAGTLVATERGQVPIEDVRAGENVWTRVGLRRVRWAGCTGVRPTIGLRTARGRLLCTDDHPVYTEAGWTPAKLSDLRSSVAVWPFPNALSAVSRSVTRRRNGAVPAHSGSVGESTTIHVGGTRASSSRGAATTATTASAATTGHRGRQAAGFSTAMSGLRRTDRSPAAGTSTTLTRTPTTTPWRTFGRSLRKGMPLSMVRVAIRRWLSKSGRASTATSGSVAGPVSTPAVSAALALPRSGCARTTVPARAVTVQWAAVERIERGPVVPVYNLTVEGQPEFFAGGLLVHNCNFTGVPGEASPDRLDATVWALSKFTSTTFGPPDAEQGAVPFVDRPVAEALGGAVQWT